MAKVRKKGRTAHSWICIGLDLSMSGCTGAGIGWDHVMKKPIQPHYFHHAWINSKHSFTDRLYELGKDVGDKITNMYLQMKMNVLTENIYIALEEPFPFGMKNSQSVKQQSQLSGALWSTLLRRRYPNIVEVNNTSWKAPIARAMGHTTRTMDKWTVKEWVLREYPSVENLPDMIRTKEGLITKPKKSKAEPAQPDDIYDAIGIAKWLSRNVKL